MKKKDGTPNWETFHKFINSGVICCIQTNTTCEVCKTCSTQSYHKKDITKEEYDSIIRKINRTLEN